MTPRRYPSMMPRRHPRHPRMDSDHAQRDPKDAQRPSCRVCIFYEVDTRVPQIRSGPGLQEVLGFRVLGFGIACNGFQKWGRTDNDPRNKQLFSKGSITNRLFEITGRLFENYRSGFKVTFEISMYRNPNFKPNYLAVLSAHLAKCNSASLPQNRNAPCL